MFLSYLLHRALQRAEVVNVQGVGDHGVRQGLLLESLGLIVAMLSCCCILCITFALKIGDTVDIGYCDYLGTRAK